MEHWTWKTHRNRVMEIGIKTLWIREKRVRIANLNGSMRCMKVLALGQ